MIYVEKNNQLEPADLEALIQNNSIHSHKIFTVTCDFNVSSKCRNLYTMELRQYIKITNNNDNKLPCIYCHRAINYSGRNNPNTKYNINDQLFSRVDTDEKAYLLGWIGSDGHIGKRGFSISIHQKDIKTLTMLRNIVCKEIPIKLLDTQTSKMCKFDTNSQKISEDLCKIFDINHGKKSDVIHFPILETDRLRYFFLRGYFEGDGCIKSPSGKKKYPIATIRSNSNSILKSIYDFVDLSGHMSNVIEWTNMRAIEFLDRIYSDRTDLVLERKYLLYQYWKTNYKFGARKI